METWGGTPVPDWAWFALVGCSLLAIVLVIVAMVLTIIGQIQTAWRNRKTPTIKAQDRKKGPRH